MAQENVVIALAPDTLKKKVSAQYVMGLQNASIVTAQEERLKQYGLSNDLNIFPFFLICSI